VLAYHPALDPYHAALRVLQLLVYHETEYELDALRILDFFLVFPEELISVRLPRDAQPWRLRVKTPKNPYWFDGDRLLTFAQMKVIQDTALSLLSAKGLIDPATLREGRVSLLPTRVPPDLEEVLRKKNADNATLVTFLVSVLGKLPVRGRDGLKDRSKLMEFRYDTA
jgi:hypothetical protein